eukprot:TRINITY_DN1351_c0_g1_i1.p1 TRINITY_DN1351_c0_g1~~TRINITY_DN1351_c0_g1_i1.p1  ORF type:complete len:614 (+),score=162.50 TRINITY_DN1351_c0_g1_i1:646-2487(+)
MKGIKHDGSPLMKIVMEWSIIHGHETILESVLGATPSPKELSEYMSRYVLSAGHKPPIVRCMVNGHVKTAQWLFAKTLPELSPEDMSVLSASLLSSANAEELYSTLALLPKIYTQKLIFAALLRGKMNIVRALEEKVKAGEKIWKDKTDADKKFLDLSDNVSVFTFNEQESAELFIKYLQSARGDSLLASLKNLSINSPTKKPEEIQKIRQEALEWLVEHNVADTLPVGRVIPAIGEFSSYKCLFDAFDKVPSTFAFNLCSNAKSQTDHLLFDYLLETKKVDVNAVDSEGNGLVYTAFVGANVTALKSLVKHEANPNLYALLEKGTTLFDLSLHSQKWKDMKSTMSLLLKFPNIQLPSPDILLLVDEPSAKLLLKAGVSAEFVNSSGLNLLQRALTAHAQPSMIKLLIESGATLDIPFVVPEETETPEKKEQATVVKQEKKPVQKKPIQRKHKYSDDSDESDDSDDDEDTDDEYDEDTDDEYDEEAREEERKVERFPPLAIAFFYNQLGLVQYMLEKEVDTAPSLLALSTLSSSECLDAFTELLEELDIPGKTETTDVESVTQVDLFAEKPTTASAFATIPTEPPVRSLKFNYDEPEENKEKKGGFSFDFEGF